MKRKSLPAAVAEIYSVLTKYSGEDKELILIAVCILLEVDLHGIKAVEKGETQSTKRSIQ